MTPWIYLNSLSSGGGFTHLGESLGENANRKTVLMVFKQIPESKRLSRSEKVLNLALLLFTKSWLLIIQWIYSAEVITHMALNSNSDNEGNRNGKKAVGLIN